MAYRELELTLLSARDLKNVNLFTRMDVYAVASISGDPMTRQCTPTDTSSGRNPSWNATLRFSVPPSAKAAGSGGWIHVLLRSERALGDRDIGEVVVPLADLLAAADGPGPQPPRLASYQVHTVQRGEPRGVLNVSYRLGPVVAPVADEKQPFFAYPAPQQPYQYRPQHEAYAPPPQPFKPQNPAPQQQHFKPQNPAPPQPYPDHVYAPPQSPANGKSNRHGPTQVYMGPHTQIIFSSAPTTPQSNNTIPAKTDDGLTRPKPSYTPTQPIISPAKIDHSWPKASPQQHQDTPTWPNASSKKPADRSTRPQQHDTKVVEHAPTQPPITNLLGKTDHSWPKASQQHQDNQTWSNVTPRKPELAHTQSKIGPGKADHSRPQEQKNTQVSNMSGRKTNDTQVGEYARTHSNIQQGKTADSTRPKEAYANSRSNSTPGKADHQSGHKAVMQHERVPSLPTATAR